MSKQNRRWFFDAPATKDGRKFIRKNRPSEETYRNFLDSVPFFTEGSDASSIVKRGLIFTLSDKEVLTGRNEPYVISNPKAISHRQIPGVGVGKDHEYYEAEINLSNGDPVDGNEITNAGIAVRAIVHVVNNIKRLGYQISIALSSLPLSQKEVTSETKVAIVDTDNKSTLIPLGDLVTSDKPRSHYHAHPETVWVVEHGLRRKPIVNIIIDSNIASAVISHVSSDVFHVIFSNPQSGFAVYY